MPYRFVIIITSNWCGSETSCMQQLSMIMSLCSMSGYSLAILRDVSRNRPSDSFLKLHRSKLHSLDLWGRFIFECHYSYHFLDSTDTAQKDGSLWKIRIFKWGNVRLYSRWINRDLVCCYYYRFSQFPLPYDICSSYILSPSHINFEFNSYCRTKW